jgi:hypothetical protein
MAGQLGSERGNIASLSDLATALWDVRDAMGTVLFKLATERLVVAAGEVRWLADANRELEIALDRLRSLELVRAIESDAAAADAGLAPGTTLAALADDAPEPWSGMLLGHRTALLELADEIAAAAAQNRRLLDAGSRRIRQTLHSITSSTGDYGQAGRPSARNWHQAEQA